MSRMLKHKTCVPSLQIICSIHKNNTRWNQLTKGLVLSRYSAFRHVEVFQWDNCGISLHRPRLRIFKVLVSILSRASFAKLLVRVRDSLLVRCKIVVIWERCDFLGELHRLSLHGVFGGEILLSNSCRLICRMILFCFAAQLLFVVGTLNLMRDEITLGLRFCGIRELRGFGWRLNSDVLFPFFNLFFLGSLCERLVRFCGVFLFQQESLHQVESSIVQRF